MKDDGPPLPEEVPEDINGCGSLSYGPGDDSYCDLPLGHEGPHHAEPVLGPVSYDGLPDSLRQAVLTRDRERCRWCGATNQGLDIHHIRYRRGAVDDVLENLVALCRACHSFVHGTPRPSGQRISKRVAQMVLLDVIEHPGIVGTARWRRLKRKFALEGLCEHGEATEACTVCPRVSPRVT